jgi:hypothetical protein
MDQVEYKDTVTIEFITKRYNGISGKVENVTPTNYTAYLETFSTTPQQIVELTDITAVDTSTFWVNFYAHTDTDSTISSRKTYYISFYWECNGVKKCERYPIAVIADV